MTITKRRNMFKEESSKAEPTRRVSMKSLNDILYANKSDVFMLSIPNLRRTHMRTHTSFNLVQKKIMLLLHIYSIFCIFQYRLMFRTITWTGCKIDSAKRILFSVVSIFC